MASRFSERQGFKPARTAIQKDGMDSALRNSLWNAVTEAFWPDSELNNGRSLSLRALFKAIWLLHFKEPLDKLPGDSLAAHYLRVHFFKCQWYEVYDLIEFVAQNYKEGYYDRGKKQGFINACNLVLERELSGYRFVGTTLSPIVSEDAISAIEQAVEQSPDSVSSHLGQALRLLSDRQQPDYRNCVKEAISAVEAMCRLVSGNQKATLGAALDALERSGTVGLHGALKGAFEKLYGYTNDAQGIRHALTGAPTLDQEDAIFMLVACSAFVNYLAVKASKAGVKLD